MTKEDGEIAVCFRFDEGLHRQLTDAARESLRSLNSEILYRVKASFRRDEASSKREGQQ